VQSTVVIPRNRPSTAAPEELLGPILRSVSRSFYVSIQLLPRRLRRPVGLAYLLARATDTVADTMAIPRVARRHHLEKLAIAIQQDAAASSINDLSTSFAPFQTDEAERKLIEELPRCLEQLNRVDGADRADIRTVLGKINRAQAMDVERFASNGAVRALSTAADLNEYTYLIAGCVGEFWTHMCSRHVSNFAELPNDRMFALGRDYGAGLQLINILRDAGSDLRAARCYFPVEELEQADLKPEQILEHPDRLMPIFWKWLDEAEKGLRAGMEYSGAIRNRRIRGATALPALIGARTARLLRAAGETVLERRIKVPRQEVRGMISSVAITLASRQTLDRMFRKALE
jgi:farnesyl-diphosphate farnesyltransferase